MIKKSLFLLVTAVLLAQLVRADRYDDLIAKWEDHGITGYSSYTSPMDLAWKVVPRLEALYYGYMVTNDVDYMDRAETAVTHWVTVNPEQDPNGDWGYDVAPGEEGRMLGAITQWCYLVKSNANLSHHVAKANSHLAYLEANMIKTWLDKYYINDEKQDPVYFHYPGTGAPIYKCYSGDCPADGSSSMLNMSAQHNKASDWALAIFWLWKATGKAEYKKVVEEVALNYKSKLIWQDYGRYYSWHYWDPTWGGDFASGECGIGPIKNSDRRWIEHRSGYGAINMKFVTDCYREGIVFCKKDIERFVYTNANIMYNPAGDWYLNDGTGSDGGRFDALAPYDASGKLADLGFAAWDVNYTGWGGMGLSYFVYVMKLAESEKHPAADPGYVGPVEVARVASIDRGTVEVEFVHEVTEESAENLSNWKLSRGTEILSVSIGTDNKTVTLKTVEQLENYDYKVTCYDVYDNLGNKTFAYSPGQPWLYTSNTIPSGMADYHRMDVFGVQVEAGPSPVRDRAVFSFGKLPAFGAGEVIISDAAGLETDRVVITDGRAAWDAREAGPGLYFYTVGTTGFTGNLLVVR